MCGNGGWGAPREPASGSAGSWPEPKQHAQASNSGWGTPEAQRADYRREGRGPTLEVKLLRTHGVAPATMPPRLSPRGEIPYELGRSSDMQGAWVTVRPGRILSLREAVQLMSPELDNLGPDNIRRAGPWDRQHSPETCGFEPVGYTTATFSDGLTLASFVDYLGRIEKASEFMADMYASNQNAPLGQLLSACRKAYKDRRTG